MWSGRQERKKRYLIPMFPGIETVYFLNLVQTTHKMSLYTLHKTRPAAQYKFKSTLNWLSRRNHLRSSTCQPSEMSKTDLTSEILNEKLSKIQQNKSLQDTNELLHY